MSKPRHRRASRHRRLRNPRNLCCSCHLLLTLPSQQSWPSRSPHRPPIQPDRRPTVQRSGCVPRHSWSKDRVSRQNCRCEIDTIRHCQASDMAGWSGLIAILGACPLAWSQQGSGQSLPRGAGVPARRVLATSLEHLLASHNFISCHQKNSGFAVRHSKKTA